MAHMNLVFLFLEFVSNLIIPQSQMFAKIFVQHKILKHFPLEILIRIDINKMFWLYYGYAVSHWLVRLWPRFNLRI